MLPVAGPDLDAEYRQVREECGLVRSDDRFWLAVNGADAAEFLQSQVTNETVDLEPGSGVYAALLDRKGHIQADMRILRLATDSFLVDTGQVTGPALLKHLTMYKIGREVEIAEAARSTISLVGPAAFNVAGLAPGQENDFETATIAGGSCLVAATAFGLDVICEPEAEAAVRAELEARRAVPVSQAAVEIVRVERGRPSFGREMSDANMPAEAGIVERAVSFTKGCYIGQEPVARLHYKGRPNRHLRGLKTAAAISEDDLATLDGRELGKVGTAVLSPAHGWIALAILRKEAEPGVTVSIDTAAGPIDAEVVQLPFSEGPDS